MPTFILLAALLTAAVAILVIWPLLRRREDAGRAPLAAIAAAVVLAGGGTALYAWLSNWSWNAPPAATTPETMVAQLARRLEKSPDDLDGWLKLGRSYLVLQQYPLATRAYQRADRLAGGRNVDALTGQAEGWHWVTRTNWTAGQGGCSNRRSPWIHARPRRSITERSPQCVAGICRSPGSAS